MTTRVTKPKPLKFYFDTITKGLEGPHGSSLWAVLTSLRGPDYKGTTVKDRQHHSALKAAITGVIRYHMGAHHYGVACRDNAESVALRKKNYRVPYTSPYYHFISHAKTGFLALGLNWDSLNVLKQDEDSGDEELPF